MPTHSYGIELIHPWREGRSEKQTGKKGKSNHHWIVGAKLCLVCNGSGQAVDWDCDTANIHHTRFHPLIRQFEQEMQEMIVLSDGGFKAKEHNPGNLEVCKIGEWNKCMTIPSFPC